MTGSVHEAGAKPVSGLCTLGKSTDAGENHGELLETVSIERHLKVQPLSPRSGAHPCGSYVMTLSTILLIVFILLLVGALPTWGHSRSWGYGPSGGLGLVVVIIVILLLMGRI